jgi:hypothetical protein
VEVLAVDAVVDRIHTLHAVQRVEVDLQPVLRIARHLFGVALEAGADLVTLLPSARSSKVQVRHTPTISQIAAR